MRVLSLLFSILLLPIGMSAPAHPNLDSAKAALREFYRSGTYFSQVHQELEKAKQYLQKRVMQNAKAQHPKRLAVVFDIDETMLSNYQQLESIDFGGSTPLKIQAFLQGKKQALPGALELFNYAKSHHVAVFFVTGRPEKWRDATVHTLHDLGFKDWNGLIMHTNDGYGHSVIPFKTEKRHQLVKKGYDIVLTIGDQWSDIMGGYADNGVKLTNPFYYID